MLLLAGTLSWLAWRLLAQDQQLSVQRLAEQRDTAADLAVAALEKRLNAVEHDLSRVLAGDSSPPASLPSGAILVEFRPGAIRAWPESGLVFYPTTPEAGDAPASSFATADELEFKKRDHSGAVAVLHGLLESSDPKVRAAALVRVARNQFKDGHPSESLDTYAQLARLGSVSVGGMPAALAAALGRLSVFERQEDHAPLVAAARVLSRDLSAARWPIPYATYQYLSDEAGRWLPEPERQAEPRVALAHGVLGLWERWTHDRAVPAGRVSVTTPLGPVLLVWRVSGSAMAGFVAGADYLESRWTAEMKPLLDARQVQLVLTDLDGRAVVGHSASGGRPAIRLASVTELPWTVQAFNTGAGGDRLSARRPLLLASMGVLLALILTGGSFIGQSVSRELAVARLQSDFVSAVSHEFRTPLTTLCQLSELLVRERVASEGDRRQYYELLHNESRRLKRLVEALLNFGALEAGKMPFHFEALDAAEALRQSAAEFTAGQQARGHRIEVDAQADAPVVRADRETLRCVFWNLFENAVKYSPDCDTVWVRLAKNGPHVEIAVRDNGVGIPRGEQRQIFEKFVRGSAARASEVRGTGIGLAMVRHIVRAHGGDITVESEPGKGSTFRVLLPAVES
jgi:signal transduction histidine kinase